MVDTVEIKASDVVLIFKRLQLLDDKISELANQQQQIATKIEDLSKPPPERMSLWKSITKFFRRA